MPENNAPRSASRYDAIVATFVGICALCVSGYTAYVQRQQVRAAVWPILEFDSSNGPIEFALANKGVGPAIIRHVIVRVDNEPVRNWKEAVDKLYRPRRTQYPNPTTWALVSLGGIGLAGALRRKRWLKADTGN